MFKVEGASKRFRDQVILENVSFTGEEGQIIGLAGPSGSGKSTLLRCIQGLELLDDGKITCDAEVGFMFQDFQLFPHMTILKNLTYAPSRRDKTTDHHSRAQKLLQDLDIAAKADLYPDQLSGGQKQRVALARSLMMQPKVLLCDEPTSGLDVATTLDVVSLLRKVQNMGVTMMIASHDLDFLTAIADKIILLNGGKIVVTIEPGEIDEPISFLKEYY